MNMKNVLLAAAAVFFIASPSLSFYVVPSMKKLPSNIDKVIYYDGKLGIMNISNVEMEYKDVEIVRHIKALEHHGNILVIREDITVKDKRTGKELKDFGMTKIYGIDEKTAANVKGYGDLDRLGNWIFPVGIKKKNYAIWNSDLDDACKNGYIPPEKAVAVGHYIGEEEKGGVKTYKFYGNQSNIYVGNLPQLPEVKMYYGGEITAWADIVTGTIIDLHKHVKEYADFPDLHKIPSNLDTTVVLKGKLTMLNSSNGRYEMHNVSLKNHICVKNVTSSYYIILNEVNATDENGKIKELCSSSKDAVNPYTMRYLQILSNKKGLMTFPVGIKKQDYELWNPDIKNSSIATYEGEEKLGDMVLYKFKQNVNNYYIGKESIEGISNRFINLYYNGTTNYLVEPSTGYIVNVEKNSKVIGSFPNLHTIPENFKGNIKMDGSLWIISQKKKNIEMDRSIEVKNVYWDNGEKVLLIKDNTTTYDKKSGNKIDMACKKEWHGVYADTAEEAKNYGDMERNGLYTFPVGVKKKDYIMWNTEINAPSRVDFVREEDHEGIHTYLFETNEDRVLYDSTPGIEQNVRYITKTKYWVEPVTGIVIDMQKESVKKINPLEALIGIRGLFWIDAYRLTLSFSKDTIENAKENALQFAGLIKLSNKDVEVLNLSLKTPDLNKNIGLAKQQKLMIEKLSGNKVMVLDLYYQMDENSINEIANEVKKSSFLLMMMQIIIPAFLAIIAIGLVAVSIKK